MSENLVTMIFEIDQEVYDQVVPLFESLGTIHRRYGCRIY